VGRIAAALGGVVAVAMWPLAWSTAGSWWLVPMHGLFSCFVLGGMFIEAWAGRPERTRAWAMGYAVASLGVAAGWQAAFLLRGASSWALPWLVLVSWTWLPLAAAPLAAAVGERVRAIRVRRVLSRRRSTRGRDRRIRA
jgi:hypothetical protein